MESARYFPNQRKFEYMTSKIPFGLPMSDDLSGLRQCQTQVLSCLSCILLSKNIKEYLLVCRKKCYHHFYYERDFA